MEKQLQILHLEDNANDAELFVRNWTKRISRVSIEVVQTRESLWMLLRQ